MQRVSKQIKNLSHRLMVEDTKGCQTTEAIATATFGVFEKLRPQLASLMGNGGFRALLTRSHALARAEVPWLSMVRVEAEGTLAATGGMGLRISKQQLIEGSGILLAHLVALMVAFIGEKITLGLIREVWPKVNITASEFDIKGIYEKET